MKLFKIVNENEKRSEASEKQVNKMRMDRKNSSQEYGRESKVLGTFYLGVEKNQPCTYTPAAHSN